MSIDRIYVTYNEQQGFFLKVYSTHLGRYVYLVNGINRGLLDAKELTFGSLTSVCRVRAVRFLVYIVNVLINKEITQF